MTRQYLRCKFKTADRRTYTYHHDGEPVRPGDKVVVQTARGRSIVEVVTLSEDPPGFPTKPIIGPHRETLL